MISNLLLLISACPLVSIAMADPREFDAFELTIPELQTAMESGQT